MDFFKKASASMGGTGGGSDILQQAEGFMGSQKSATPTSTASRATSEAAPAGGILAQAAAPAPGSADGAKKSSDVYGSAQTLYQGLQGKLGGNQSNIDDQQLAGAASDVLKAGQSAGFAKDSQYAGYFDKADTYLQNYGKSGAAAAKSAAPSAAADTPAAALPAVHDSTGAQ